MPVSLESVLVVVLSIETLEQRTADITLILSIPKGYLSKIAL